MVHTHHKHKDTTRKDRDDDPFGSIFRESSGPFHCRGLHSLFSTTVSPLGRISPLKDKDRLSFHQWWAFHSQHSLYHWTWHGCNRVHHVAEISEEGIGGDSIARVESSAGYEVKSVYFDLYVRDTAGSGWDMAVCQMLRSRELYDMLLKSGLLNYNLLRVKITTIKYTAQWLLTNVYRHWISESALIGKWIWGQLCPSHMHPQKN